MTKEEIRLVECQRREKHWKRWGPYLNERACALKNGDRAPAFILNNQDGTSISSAELLAKGRLVIISSEDTGDRSTAAKI
jgi:hypothetical protein